MFLSSSRSRNMCWGEKNSQYFHIYIIGDGKLNPRIGVYIPIIRIPYQRGDDHPQCKELIDPGTYDSRRLPLLADSICNMFHKVSSYHLTT